MSRVEQILSYQLLNRVSREIFLLILGDVFLVDS